MKSLVRIVNPQNIEMGILLPKKYSYNETKTIDLKKVIAEGFDCIVSINDMEQFRLVYCMCGDDEGFVIDFNPHYSKTVDIISTQ